jgi:murein L,D-transpeptidase YafK
MLYSDKELLNWWKGLARSDQEASLNRMVKRARTYEYRLFAQDLRKQYDSGKPFSPKQLAIIRKWHYDH